MGLLADADIPQLFIPQPLNSWAGLLADADIPKPLSWPLPRPLEPKGTEGVRAGSRWQASILTKYRGFGGGRRVRAGFRWQAQSPKIERGQEYSPRC